MNRVLVTGLALGTDIGTCSVCNFDVSWIIRYPSILLWADEILISELMWKSIIEEAPYVNPTELRKSLRIIFELLESEGVVKVINVAELFNETVRIEIGSTLDNDYKMLLKHFPYSISLGDEKVPGEIIIDGSEYCKSYLSSLYAALLIGRKYNANCLFNDRDYNFMKYKFGLQLTSKIGSQEIPNALNTIFKSTLPNISLLHDYSFRKDSQCTDCQENPNCLKEYLIKTENNTKDLLKWRSYDEISQLKEMITSIIRKRTAADGVISSEEIISEFQDKEQSIRKKIRSVFPKVKRWSNITTLLSLPIAIAGISIGDPVVATSGASVAGLSIASREIIDYLKSKYSWIGFTLEDTP